LSLNILLLSGYDAASHKQWRNRLVDNLSTFRWTELILPARHFAWRTRGSSLSLAFSYGEQLQARYDLILATSMVDLASLRGFVPNLASIPTIVYFHENQFVYPVSHAQPNILNAQLTSIYSALCADRLVFNSNYNLNTFITGAAHLLKRLPDAIPPGLIELLQQKSQVLAVPLEDPVEEFSNSDRADFSCRGQESGSQSVDKSKRTTERRVVDIVWNHRWEYDKRPEVFFAAMLQLRAHGVAFRIHVLGQSFRQVPACFKQAKRDFAKELGAWGYQPRVQYLAILQSADIVVSTALHDFQGLSMLEAIQQGCVPIAPDRVAYPEYIPRQNLYSVDPDETVEATHLFQKLIDIIDNNATERPDIARFSIACLSPQYESLIQEVAVIR
jgi:glycosyltransferase involved in cell wall biosynthesis